jgi:hypothetical protein
VLGYWGQGAHGHHEDATNKMRGTHDYIKTKTIKVSRVNKIAIPIWENSSGS